MNTVAKYQGPGFEGNWMWCFAGRQSQIQPGTLKQHCTAKAPPQRSFESFMSSDAKHFRTPATKYFILNQINCAQLTQQNK